MNKTVINLTKSGIETINLTKVELDNTKIVVNTEKNLQRTAFSLSADKHIRNIGAFFKELIEFILQCLPCITLLFFILVLSSNRQSNSDKCILNYANDQQNNTLDNILTSGILSVIVDEGDQIEAIITDKVELQDSNYKYTLSYTVCNNEIIAVYNYDDIGCVGDTVIITLGEHINEITNMELLNN